MAKIDIQIPEPSPVYTEENQRQVSQSLQTMKDKLNTSYQQELKNEQDTFNWFIS
jgi:DNA primase